MWHNTFLRLKTILATLKDKSREEKWAIAFQWKDATKDAINKAFKGIDNKAELCNELENLFDTPLCAVVEDSLVRNSQQIEEEQFNSDVNSAIKLIEKCIQELTHQQTTSNC